MRCIHCGEEISPNAKFCVYCGEKVEPNAVRQPEKPAAAGNAAAAARTGFFAGIGGKIAIAAVAGAVVIGGGIAVKNLIEEKKDDAEPAVLQEEPAPAEETVPAETAEEPVTGRNAVVWVHEPNMRLDEISELVSDNLDDEFMTTTKEFIGYPQEWDYTLKAPYYSNSIEVKKDGRYGISDYTGIYLCEPFLPEYSETNEYGSVNRNGIMYRSDVGFYSVDYTKMTQVDEYRKVPEYRVFHNDFKHTNPCEEPGGVGGDPGPAISNLNGKLVYAYGGEIYPAEDDPNAFDRHPIIRKSLIQMIDESGNVIGYSLYDEGFNHVADYPGAYLRRYHLINYVNGFCAFSDRDNARSQNGFYETDNYGKLALYNMTTGEPVTEFIYDDVKWFEDGYCPVKKGSKWAFIDETGTEVTDFIFDDVSGLYHGKTFVGINGVYGIMDLQATVESRIPVTLETCYGDAVPEEKPAAEVKNDNTPIGTALVKTDNLNSRAKPGTNGTKLVQVEKGTEYPVYEIAENEGYTWYRIGEGRWIADKGGSWVEYNPN